MSKKSKLVGLALLALVLVTALGAKMYSNVTMGDDEWIGLGPNAGRIVFDDQDIDEVNIMNAKLGLGTSTPNYMMQIYGLNASFLQFTTNDTGAGTPSGLVIGVEGGENPEAVINYKEEAALNIKTSGVSRVYVGADGDVGLGTSYPVWDLDILDDGGAAYLQVKSTASDAGLIMDAVANIGDARMYWRENGGNKWGLHYYAPNDYLRLFNYVGSDTAIYFHDNGNINLVPDAGNVKIGSPGTPSCELDVDGDIDASGTIHADTQVSSGGHVFASGDVFAIGDITAHESLRTSNDVIATYGGVYADHVFATGVVSSSGYVYAYTSVYANADVVVGDDVLVYDDIHADGNVSADGDVTAGGSVFIGSVEDNDEDGARMFVRADNDDGGHVVWSIRNFEGGVFIFENAAHGGTTGPDMVLWVQWIAHSNTTDEYVTGDAMLVNGPHVQDRVTIMTDAPKEELGLFFYEGGLSLGTAGSAGHLYDVTLVITWVED